MDVTLEFMVWGLLAFRESRSLGSQSQMLLQYGIGLYWRLWWRLPWRQILRLSRRCCATLSKSVCFPGPSRHAHSPAGRTCHWAPSTFETQSAAGPQVPCCLLFVPSAWVGVGLGHICHPCSLSTGGQLLAFTCLYGIKHLQMLYIFYLLTLQYVCVKIIPILQSSVLWPFLGYMTKQWWIS